MKKYIKWYYSQKKSTRFLVLLGINSFVFIVVWLIVNTISGEPWHSGIIGGFVVAILSAYWSLNDKKSYQQQKRKSK